MAYNTELVIGRGTLPTTDPYNTSGPSVPVLDWDYSYVSEQKLEFDASASTYNAGAIFVWNFGDGSTATGITVQHQYATGLHLTAEQTGSGVRFNWLRKFAVKLTIFDVAGILSDTRGSIYERNTAIGSPHDGGITDMHADLYYTPSGGSEWLLHSYANGELGFGPVGASGDTGDTFRLDVTIVDYGHTNSGDISIVQA